MREAQCIEDYFDPFDIQINPHAFLTCVLELIVCWNLFKSIQKVDSVGLCKGLIQVAVDVLKFNRKAELANWNPARTGYSDYT